MGKQRQSALILGEGPTEFYYFQSLRDVYGNLVFEPGYPKHTSIKELEIKIKNGIAAGYSHIFCVIDMDTKEEGTNERKEYEGLKSRYSKPIVKRGQGIRCEVEFFETHRCTELFFLYYF